MHQSMNYNNHNSGRTTTTTTTASKLVWWLMVVAFVIFIIMFPSNATLAQNNNNYNEEGCNAFPGSNPEGCPPGGVVPSSDYIHFWSDTPPETIVEYRVVMDWKEVELIDVIPHPNGKPNEYIGWVPLVKLRLYIVAVAADGTTQLASDPSNALSLPLSQVCRSDLNNNSVVELPDVGKTLTLASVSPLCSIIHEPVPQIPPNNNNDP